ncbi:MAG: site-specific DNA-methyltransferase [Sideroxydans sp.]|nr:site-specific DNA-methyltransferase [Sideroxydans sp.]
MNKKQKLELTWIGKENRPKLEPRILLEDAARSYHAKHRVTDGDIFDNQLIFGDNLLALKALEAELAGKVKCVFIDPPYNTGSAFTHYDDGVEHSIWLSLMRDRLEIIRRLLSEDGSLWITIDDNEAHYLKVLCDEVFGRACFVTSFIWKKVDSPNDNKGALSPDHEYVLCFSKVPAGARFRQKQDDSILNAYRQPDAESDRPYRDRLLKKNGKNSLRSDRPSMYFPIKGPDGIDVFPIHDDGQEARWAMGQKGVDEVIAKGELVWKQRELNGVTRWVPYTREYAPDSPSRPWPTIWADLDTTRQTKAHQKVIFGDVTQFETPKPEDLISRIFGVSTNPGDLVLDSFAGSGTTGAVAHKMGRRWIMIELGEHCHTHIIPRLQKVIDGEDKGGISEAVNWQGGGGFRYYKLAPSLLRQDAHNQWVINKEYNAEMLAQALCKLEGFTYAPSDAHYWMHGHSTERDFIYVTTANLNHEQLQQLSDEVGAERSLLVLCTAFRGRGDYPNLTVKKIPKQVLTRCEWGHDDYSLQVENLPQAPHPSPLPQAGEGTKAKTRAVNAAQGGLFEEGEA